VSTEGSLAEALSGIKQELKEFVQTRAQIFRVETQEKLRSWKKPAAMLALAAVFLLSAWFACVFAFVALLHGFIVAGSYSWFWGSLIVGGVFLVAALAVGRAGYRSIKAASLAPQRTLRVLKQDQNWIRDRVRSA
jgi:energy-coupling factor transporter transmembrane protein EcfT